MDPVEAQPRQIYFFDTPDLHFSVPALWSGRGASGRQGRHGDQASSGRAR